MASNSIKILSPATIANVACGYDVLGFCLDITSDEITVTKTTKKGIRIAKIEGCELPYEVENNVAGISALALYKACNPNCGFDIELKKCITPGSGMGSSAASAVGSVFAINELLDRPFNKTELLKFAIKGEAFASKNEHADNLAPAMYGGFTLVKSVQPLTVLQLPVLDDLYAIVIHPQIEIKTAEARQLLPKSITMLNAIKQWANVGSFIHALHTKNYSLLGSSLVDYAAEPYRKTLIPLFDEVKQAVLHAGALGCSIAGSGPSIFALCKGQKIAQEIKKALNNVYTESDIAFNVYISTINTKGVHF